MAIIIGGESKESKRVDDITIIANVWPAAQNSISTNQTHACCWSGMMVFDTKCHFVSSISISQKKIPRSLKNQHISVGYGISSKVQYIDRWLRMSAKCRGYHTQ